MLFVPKIPECEYLSEMLAAIIPLYQTGKSHKEIGT